MHSTTERAAPPRPRPAPDRLLAGVPVRSRWRLPAAVGAAAMTVAHVPVLEEHLATAPLVGVGFALLSVVGIVLAALLLSADTARVWAAAGLVAALAIAGYLLSRSVGLPTIRDDVGHWADPLGILALAGEGLLLLTALLSVPAATRAARRRTD
ncbi:hypothetical protein [Actinocatenispora comari]|jgi:hypothetical protein|uniref:Uncharacterized protein n=1 Tax=Actinocatenispora comari TaxID=2807577 RepID=A0A8J4EK84_9ACTN|nr:hypothetical protein [Actinocatenispora comari]GIL27922.1 hypothetical protein NUM_31760 [Actinocatenispora comari]